MQTRQWRSMLYALVAAVLIPIASMAQIERGASRAFTLEDGGKLIELGHYHAVVIGNSDYKY